MLLPIILAAQSILPDFTLETMDGRKITLSEVTAESGVILSFWATWCKPCVRELGKLEEMEEFLAQHNVIVIAVNEDGPRTRPRVKPFVTREGWSFDILMDPGHRVKNQSGIAELPETFIIGANNEVFYRHSGYKPGDEAIYERKVRELFAPKEND